MDTNTRQHIAETIRRGRLKKGWQVQEAARVVGVTPSNWSRWETATSTPRPAMLVTLADLFDLPDDWATVQHPVTRVESDVDVRLAELAAEVKALHELVEQTFTQMKERDHDDHQPGRQRQRYDV